MGANDGPISNATKSPFDDIYPDFLEQTETDFIPDMDWQTDFVCVNCEGDVDDGREDPLKMKVSERYKVVNSF